MTVFARSMVSARSEVDSRGSLKNPNVLNAGDGRRYTSNPRLANSRSADRAAPNSKKPLYGTRPTIGNHHVYGASRSGYAPESTRTSVSRSSWVYVVKLSRVRRWIESAANARAARTRRSFAAVSADVAGSATIASIERRRARIDPSAHA